MLLKILVFFFFLYLIFRVVNFFFKVMRTVSGAKQQAKNFNRQHQNGYNASYGPKSRKYKQPSDGNVNIDYIPEEDKKNGKGPRNFKGGEYVDYEEIK
ncbi:hypothetical protein OKW21_005633 [Catalinimonas alkaloidigena]|uniref:DUF4834 family protein n=1 Tax=Catalinimonas alkaloidigena TaxID=1075417 RepID=UPI0024051257|nr:DUF4834 family protein [Catalinimonas alkaloidigena]MDF9800370.1 hypothetical protein [Catalinimonas alkaloidigena]